jgi:hypothetical protein
MGSESPMTCEHAFDDDQVGRYVAAELSEAERDAFEIHFLECAPCRQALEVHLDLVEALRADRPLAAVPAPPLPKTRAIPASRAQWPGLAAAAGLVLATLGWLGGQHSAGQRFETEREALRRSTARLEEQVRESQSEQERIRAELARPRDVVSTSFALSPGVERGESAPAPLSLTAPVSEARFELDLQTVRSYPTFEVELRGPKGEVLWSQARLRAEGPEGERVLVARVPAAVLRDGPHELILRGTAASGALEEAAVYDFSLRRR